MITQRECYGGAVMLHVVDYHGEYAIPPHPDVRMCIAWDQMSMEELFGEETCEQFIIDHLPEPLKALWGHDGNVGHVIAIEGTPEKIQEMWRAYYATLFANETGGDDDTYDYWPNAMGVAKQIADDLDTLDSGDRNYELFKAYQAYVEKFGLVDDYTYGDGQWEKQFMSTEGA